LELAPHCAGQSDILDTQGGGAPVLRPRSQPHDRQGNLVRGHGRRQATGGQNPPSQVRVSVNSETIPTLLSESKDAPGQYQGTPSTVLVFGTAFTLGLVGLTADQIAAMEDVVLVVHYALS